MEQNGKKKKTYGEKWRTVGQVNVASEALIFLSHIQSIINHSSLLPSMSDVPEGSTHEPEIDEAVDETSPDSEIWKREEKVILQEHLEAYKEQPRKAKTSFVSKTVLPKIKTIWGDRYKKEKCRKDKALKEQWGKKKKVRHLFPAGPPERSGCHTARYRDDHIQDCRAGCFRFHRAVPLSPFRR